MVFNRNQSQTFSQQKRLFQLRTLLLSRPSDTTDSDDDISLISSLAPPTNLPSSTRTTAFPTSSQSNLMPSFSTTQYMPNMNQNQQSYKPSVEIQQHTSPADFESVQPVQPLLKMLSELQAQPERNIKIQQVQSTQTTENLPQTPVVTLTTFNQPQSTETSQDIQFELVPQNGQTSIGPEFSTSRPPQTIPPPPNYFLIYQQAPQSIQSYPNPSSSPRSTVGDASFTTTRSPITSTLSPTFSSPSPTFSTIPSLPVTMRTSPLLFSTTQPLSTQYVPSSTSPRISSFSTIGSSSSTSGPRITNCGVSTPTLRPRLPNDRPISLPIDQLFPVNIRVVAPSGSITNVNFNSPAKPPTSTRRPTTRRPATRKPTTRRPPKPRKNTYERCLQGCRKNGQPLCAGPLSQFPIDSKTLRGFPSVCHMACYNSYRKDAFEKIIDGSCSRLRTRIRPVDSDSKLKREELQKVQYFLDNSGQQPIFEFTGAYS